MSSERQGGFSGRGENRGFRGSRGMSRGSFENRASRGGFGSRGRGFSSRGESNGYRGGRGMSRGRGSSENHGFRGMSRGRGFSSNSRGEKSGDHGSRGMSRGRGSSENRGSRGMSRGRGFSSRGEGNGDHRGRGMSRGRGSSENGGSSRGGSGYRGRGGRGRGRAFQGGSRSDGTRGPHDDGKMSDSKEETKANTLPEFEKVFQVFTGFRGETLFSQRDREAKEKKIKEAAKLLKEQEKHAKYENSTPVDGMPKRLGILSKIIHPDHNTKRSASHPNMVANSAEMQVFDLSHVTESKITGVSHTSTRAGRASGRGIAGRGRGRGVKKNLSGSWSVETNLKANESHTSSDTSNRKRAPDLDGSISKRTKV